jgi:hypothetical protein
MSKILFKQINNLFEYELPNIKLIFNEQSITNLKFIFYYKKSDIESAFPSFLPRDHINPILIKGTVNLDNFPNRPPKLILHGDVAHSHVHPINDFTYAICFSLDETYQWFFNGMHLKSSKFNPSISVRYYLIAVYRFLAEDDFEHPVTAERKLKCLYSWDQDDFKSNDMPTTLLPYNESLQFMINENDHHFNAAELEYLVKRKYDLRDEIPQNILKITDFVEKDFLLLQDDPIVYPIDYNRIGDRHVYKIVSLDLMKKSTFDNGVKKTSMGIDFDNCIPLVIHSKIWNYHQSIDVLRNIVDQTCKSKINSIIKLNNAATINDHYLYIISELFNELAIDVFSETMFPCDEVLKGFMYLHHLLLLLGNNDSEFEQCHEKLLDMFESQNKYRDKKICPNLGILMTQYLLTKKDRDYNILIDELLTRNVLWSLKKVSECKDCVKYDIIEEKFLIIDLEKWINVTWKNSYMSLQRFAFQQSYNDRFHRETISSLDERFGQVSEMEIDFFQKEIKDLQTWKNLDGVEGYQIFFKYFNLDIFKLEEKIYYAMEKSTQNGYHSFLINREWKLTPP